jgi:radical SAM protein with 4Fe4S-binding SPASM domain
MGTNTELPRFSTYEVILTHDCNCRCAYCYESAQLTTVTTGFSPDTFSHAIGFIHSTYDRTAAEITVVFFGGEPLLSFERMQQFINELKDIPNIRFAVSTNLTTATRAQLDQLIAQKMAFQVSLDGKQEVHDLNRGQGMYVETMKRLAYLVAKKANVRLRMTVAKNTIIRFAANFIFINSFELPFVWYCDVSKEYTEEKLREFLRQLHRAYEHVGARNFDQTIQEFIGKQQGHCPCIDPDKTITIRYDGALLPCSRITTELGTVQEAACEGLNPNPLAGNKNPSCYNCQSIAYCKGGCLGAHREAAQNLNKVFCDIQRLIHIFVLERTIKGVVNK